ncbi:hypothetical protein GALL_470070 [mine drainage metagenome]|uniref:Uncharacterized protein n=1 Tax=mine drainage metagenome TaxID=410659 RepID=A0A1J5PUF9_9ZZZZ
MPGRRILLGLHRPRGQPGTHAIDRARQATGHRFSQDQRVGLQAMGHGIPPRATAEGMGFIQDQQGPVLSNQCLRLVPKTGLRQHHANVGHHRFSQYAGDRVVLQG